MFEHERTRILSQGGWRAALLSRLPPAMPLAAGPHPLKHFALLVQRVSVGYACSQTNAATVQSTICQPILKIH
eukprot:1761850-Pleurochrysis_carterae.AAC.1